MSNSHEPRELELKYRATGDGRLEQLRRDSSRLAGFRLGPRHSVATVDLYWDTADYALTRSGFGLRLRRQDQDFFVTLKELVSAQASALTNRIEVEQAIVAYQVDSLLASRKLNDLLSVLVPDDNLPATWERVVLHKANPRLHPLVRVRQRREKRVLAEGTSRSSAVAELSIDTVSVDSFAMDASNEQLFADAQSTTHFVEVEVEGAPGVPASILEKIDGVLGRKRALQPSGMGKVEAALRMVTAGEVGQFGAVEPTTSMAEAGRQIWRRQLVEILFNEYAIRARTGDAEDAVHDMRVAIRRIRAAARIFGPFFKRKAIRAHLGTLRDLARSLGAARDLDVSINLVKQYQDELGEQAAILSAVRAKWEEHRDLAYQSLQERLSSKSHSRFIRRFAHFCQTPGLGRASGDLDEQELAAQEIRHVMPSEIFAHYANMRVYESVIHDETPPETFHALRIEGKQLRYALEFVQPLLDPKAATSVIEKLKQLQECLGNMNDAVVMQDRLRQFAVDTPQLPSAVPVIEYLSEQIAQERAHFGELWEDFVSPSTRRHLAMAVAAL